MDRDINLLALTRRKRGTRDLATRIEEAVYDVGLAAGVVYSLLVLPRHEFRRWFRDGVAFAREVITTGVTRRDNLLYGFRR